MSKTVIRLINKTRNEVKNYIVAETSLKTAMGLVRLLGWGNDSVDIRMGSGYTSAATFYMFED